MEELDYNATINSLFERINTLLQADEEYFALLTLIGEKGEYSNAITKHIFNLRKQDQLKLMRCAAETALVAEELCLKYGISVSDTGDET